MFPVNPTKRPGPKLAAMCGLLAAAGVLSLCSVPAHSSGGKASEATPLKEEKSLLLGLRNSAKPLMDYLKKNKYENVGVLKFLIKVGEREASFHAGRLNDFMATRLENALILINSKSDPIGITRDASTVAAKEAAEKKVNASYLKEKDRQQLFKFEYPLAWGGKSTKVDAFLTGVVKMNVKKNKRSLEVYLCAFDSKNPGELKVVHSFKTTTLDRYSLAEAGIKFAVTKRSLNVANSIADVDNAAEIQIGTGPIDPVDPNPNPGDGLGPVDAEFDKVLDFRILYNDIQIPLLPNPDGTFNCPPPKKGQVVHFVLKSSERIGLVLFVNGVNTLLMDKYTEGRPLGSYARWILEPGQEYVIEGFYPSFKEVRPFAVASEAEADLGDLGPTPNWGRIEMHVFRQGGPVKPKPETPFGNLNLGGNPDPDDSFEKVKNELAEDLFKSVTKKNLLMPRKGPNKATDIEEVPFVGVLSLHRTITYHQIGGGPNPFDPGE